MTQEPASDGAALFCYIPFSVILGGIFLFLFFVVQAYITSYMIA